MNKTHPIPKEQVIVDFSLKGEKKGEAKASLIKRIEKQEDEALGNGAENTASFTNKLVNLSDQPEEILMKMKTVFPFDFFPDRITIDPVKVQIIQKYFFLSQTVKTIPVKDIVDATVETGPLTSTLEIATKEDDKPIRISYIRTKDAEKAMKIIKGLIIARNEAP